MVIKVDRQLLAIRVLEILNGIDGSRDTVNAQQELLKEMLGLDAVGIRLRKDNDFPFHASSGFSPEFLAVESTICAFDPKGRLERDDNGEPILECVCGAVLKDNLRREAPYRTAGGSFWSNSLGRLVSDTPPEQLPPRPRLTCNQEGYETMAVIPLRSSGEVVGLLQLNDSRPELLDEDLVTFIEGLANSIGVGIEKQSNREALDATHELVRKTRDVHEATLDTLRIGIFRMNGAGHIDFLNRAAERFCGISREQMVGEHYTKLCFVSERFEQFVTHHFASGQQEGRLRIETEGTGGALYRLDLEVKRDQVVPEDMLIFLYDVTDVTELRRRLEHRETFHELVGRSNPMTDLFRRIQEVATVDFTVLIEGETGTGKELVAKAIHASSNRRKGPFVAVNCAGLTETLLTSQLFGHKRGAFTGAVADHKGYFEAAAGGTLFLDEIGDISANLQATLLRVLEEKRVTRVGDSHDRAVDVRIVTATHHDLAEDARVGRFRQDLLYRLRIARLILPPLSARREDIPLLVGHFLRNVGAVTGKEARDVSVPAMRLLMRHPWPGNVRELKAAVEFASLHAVGPTVAAEDLPPELRGEDSFAMSQLPSSLEADIGLPPVDGREAVLAALKAAGGNRSKAALQMGVSRATFYRRLTEYGLDGKSLSSEKPGKGAAGSGEGGLSADG
jgi:PAS domain S-box-containing protein